MKNWIKEAISDIPALISAISVMDKMEGQGEFRKVLAGTAVASTVSVVLKWLLDKFCSENTSHHYSKGASSDQVVPPTKDSKEEQVLSKRSYTKPTHFSNYWRKKVGSSKEQSPYIFYD